MNFFKAVVVFLRVFLVSRASLAAENVALRQQLNVLQRSVKRPKLRWRDRLFWVWLSRLWAGWRSCLMLVKPETMIHWHRRGFKRFWRWKAKAGKVGRPKIDPEIRDLIRRMSSENVACGGHRESSPSCSWAPRYLLRDRDEIFSTYVQQHIQHMGIEEMLTAPRSPWQNPSAERVIGSIRRECLDHAIVLNERHLKRVLSRSFDVYGFAKNARANIKADELKGLKAYADILLNYNDKELNKAVKTGVLIEVESDG